MIYLGGFRNRTPVSSFPETRQANKPPWIIFTVKWVKADEVATHTDTKEKGIKKELQNLKKETRERIWSNSVL